MLSEQHLVGWDFLCCTGVLLLPILVEWKPLKVPESYVVTVNLIAGTCVWFQINCYQE